MAVRGELLRWAVLAMLTYSYTHVRCACCALSALNFTLLAHATRLNDRKFQV